MGTKMKGLLKGLRYISQIFDEEKEPEMQIGFPTDVKHVAHIGWDGPSVDSPSWMKDLKAPQAFQSAPLNVNGESRENLEIKWVSQDSTRRRSLGSLDSPTKDMAELPKTTRRHSSADSSSTSDYPAREHSTKSRQSRKNSSESSKPTRQPKDSANGSDSSSQNLSDIPKKSRRKKSKESASGESSRPSRSRANAPSTCSTSPHSDPRPDPETIPAPIGSELSQISSLKPYVKEGEDKGCNGIS